MKKIHFSSIDSTNTYGKEFILTNKEFHKTLITADMQTNGRGRLNKTFYSENGLYMSLLLDDRHKDYPLTLTSAVAVSNAVKELFNIDLKIKWVNDLLYNNKKVCGILTEAIYEENKVKGFVCGIGLNTKNVIIPPDLKEIADVIPTEKTNELTERIAEKIIYMYENNISPVKAYKENLILNVPVCAYKNDKKLFTGIATDILENGNLVVVEDNNTHILNSGEISIIYKNKEETK
ncbi:MAG: biotin--[Clostridia bacterium]|nr:biotin--[acetyl-CoA-carboxylase] ligase [Clostridia bacterium]